MSPSPPYGASRPDFRRTQPGDRLVAVGAALFGVGLMATLVTVVPFFLGTHPLPLPFYVAAMLGPLGFAVAGVGLVRSLRNRRRGR